MKKIFMFLFGLLAMTSCTNDDNETVGPATAAQYEAVSGHWYAEIPISGETDNWRTEEEGDVTTYNAVDAVFYLGSGTFDGDIITNGWWGYLYMQDGDMMNYGGLRINEDDGFTFTMTSDGYITPSSHVQNAPQITNMHYDAKADVITADVAYNGRTLSLTFVRPVDETMQHLNELYEILYEEGIIGGYYDGGWKIDSDVTDDDATEPMRARRR